MERPMGLEPTPTAWQAVVLPLYYGRAVLKTLACPLRNDKKDCGLPTSVARRPPIQTSQLQACPLAAYLWT